ncbi:MAG: hypothetical protein Q7R47_03425 [Candidatus Diapherotrites archaeon]|nr:hypothetical protein [Candidatus Diapherotrites archaeon]
MSWTEIETPNAKYLVVLERHSRPQRIPNRSIDAWFFEAAGLVSVENFSSVLFQREMSALRIGVSPKTVFFGDHPNVERLEKSLVKRDLVFFAAATAIGAPFLGYFAIPTSLALRPVLHVGAETAFSHVAKQGPLESHPFREKIYSLSDRIFYPSEMSGFRDALISEKCERGIAPMLQKELGRKPVIGVSVGASHKGILNLLQNPTDRRRMLSRYNIKNRADFEEYVKLHRLKQIQKGIWKLESKPAAIQMPAFRPISRRLRSHTRLAVQKMKRTVKQAGRKIVRRKGH